jgi:hypothetical protein
VRYLGLFVLENSVSRVRGLIADRIQNYNAENKVLALATFPSGSTRIPLASKFVARRSSKRRMCEYTDVRI